MECWLGAGCGYVYFMVWFGVCVLFVCDCVRVVCEWVDVFLCLCDVGCGCVVACACGVVLCMCGCGSGLSLLS